MPELLEILSVSIGSSRRDHDFTVKMFGRDYHVRRIGTDGDKSRAIELIKEADGKTAAIGLGGSDVFFRIGKRTYVHQDSKRFMDAAQKTPVVDGVGLKHTLERWAIKWVLQKRPGLFDNRKTLVVSGLDRWGISEVLGEYTSSFIFGDFMYAMKIPIQLRSLAAVERTARWVMPILCHIPFEAIYPTGKRQETVRPIFQGPFEWAEVIVGDYHYIRRYAPKDLEGKIVVTNTVMKEDEDDLKGRGVTTLITTTPDMDGRSFGTNVLEALFVAHLNEEGEKYADLTFEQQNDRYLSLIRQAEIEPRLIDLAPPPKPDLPKFGFVVHPLQLEQLFQVPIFKPLKALPKQLVEESAAQVPGFFVSKATGIKTPDGLEVEGYFYALGATPKMMQKLPPEHFYRQMITLARLVHKKGAGILGLGAFTSVIGDAGITVAKRSPIAITTGNHYTVWATLESVRLGTEKMGINLRESRAMVIGATGSIGKIVARMLAAYVAEMILVAPKPERLMELAGQLEEEAVKDGREIKVDIAMVADDHLSEVDVIVAATTAHGGIIDVMKLKPGALVCDVAQPPDVSREEAGKRNDILVIEAGEIIVPGDIHWGFDLGLPRNVAFACLSETILLALEKRYESFTLGRELEPEKVKEIGEIGKKHGFRLTPIRAFGKEVSDDEIARIRQNAGR